MLGSTFWRAIILLVLTASGSALSKPIVTPGLAVMANALAPGHEGVFLAQMVASAPSFAMFAMAPFVGWAAEKIGYRFAFIMGTIGLTLSGISAFLFPQLIPLMLARFVGGVAGSALLTGGFALINHYFESRKRDQMFGFLSGTIAAIAVISSAIAGYCVIYFGWSSVFLLQTYPVLLLLILIPLTRDSKAFKVEAKAKDASDNRAALRTMFGLLALIMWITMMSLSTGLQFPFLMKERGIGDPRLIALSVMTMTAAMFLASFGYGWLVSKVKVGGVLAIMVLMMGINHVLMGLATTITEALISVTFSGIAAAFIYPVGASYIFENLPAAIHGRATGLLTSATFLGSFANPFVLAPFTAMFGFAPCLIALGALNLVVAAALAIPAYRRLKPSS